jgi:protein kinase/serine/threonine-protein kinase
MSGSDRGLATFVRNARGHALWKTLGVYLVASWVALQVVDFLAQNFGMPDWFPAFAVALLVIGLPIVLATAIVQGGPAPGGIPPTGGAAEATPDASVGALGGVAPAGPGAEAANLAGGTGSLDRLSSRPSKAQRMFTWRNAVLGGMAAFALWGVIATAWILTGGVRSGATEDSDPFTALRTVAVLPFSNLSTDADNAFFADGIHEDVLTQLSKLEDLTVISRTSVLAYRETTQNLADIGDELGAGAIVEGSVRRSGDNVRITAQLIDASSDEHLWADNFDRALTAANVFAIQSEIAQRIAEALAATLTPEVEQAMSRAPTSNLEAYDFVLRGREAYRQYTDESNNTALARFQGALERDPNYAEAWAGIADVYGQRVFRYGYGMEWADSSEAAGRRAVQLNPDLPSALKALALAHSARGEVQASIELLLRANGLDPNYPDAMNNLAVDLSTQGKLDEAHRWYRRAFRLQPNVAFARSNFASSYSALGEVDIAITRLHEAVELDPSDPTPRAYLTMILWVDGREDEALAMSDGLLADYPDMVFAVNWATMPRFWNGDWEIVRDLTLRSLELSPDQDLFAWYHARDMLALAHLRLGNAGEAERLFSEGEAFWNASLERTQEQPGLFAQRAALYAARGETDAALSDLDRAYRGGFKGHRSLDGSPFFESVQDDPRFRSLIDQMQADKEPMRLTIEREEIASGER